MKYTCIMGSKNPKAEWLSRAILSVQGLFDEYVFVDDGSDRPIQWHTDFLDNVKIIRHDVNKGFWAAKNTAIEASTGDIIATLDDDDYFDKYEVQKLKMFIEQNSDNDVYRFKLQEVGESNGIYDGGGDLSELDKRNSIPGVSWFRRQVWKDVGGFKNVKAEDWAFWRAANNLGKKFIFFNEICYHVQMRGDSVSHSWNVPYDEIRNEVLNNS
jgi:glycosyltransferase involved in cell wall biosynthesis